MHLPSSLFTHTLAFAVAFSFSLSSVFACTHCPHPGVFTAKLGVFTNPSRAYCGLEDTPADAIYAAVSSKFYNPPDESPCDAPINVTNPVTNLTIQAIVVGQCKTCTGDEVFLTNKGFEAIVGNLIRRQWRAPATVEWTFA